MCLLLSYSKLVVYRILHTCGRMGIFCRMAEDGSKAIGYGESISVTNPRRVFFLESGSSIDGPFGKPIGMMGYVYQYIPYAHHGAGIIGIYKPTQLGDFGQGQMLLCIFQHHGSHMDMYI